MAWPASKPDYRWPADVFDRGAAFASLRTFTFHVCHAVGRIASLGVGRRRLLVIRTDGIGDAVLSEPALRSLAMTIGGGSLDVWATPVTCDLLADTRYVTRRSLTPRGGKTGNLAYVHSIAWHARLGWRLGLRRYDIAVYSVESPEPLGNWLFLSARARERWYNPGDTANQFAWQRQRTSAAATRLLAPSTAGGHELARNAAIARQWDAHFAAPPPAIGVNPTARGAADAQLTAWRTQAASLDAAAVVGVMPGTFQHEKRYPLDRWANAILRLWHDAQIVVALLGGPGDIAALDDIEAALPSSCPRLRLARPTDLRAMAAIVGGLDGFVGVDTGVTHLAMLAAVPTAVIALRGEHAGRFFPWPDRPRQRVFTGSPPTPTDLARAVVDLLDHSRTTSLRTVPKRAAG